MCDSIYLLFVKNFTTSSLCWANFHETIILFHFCNSYYHLLTDQEGIIEFFDDNLIQLKQESLLTRSPDVSSQEDSLQDNSLQNDSSSQSNLFL